MAAGSEQMMIRFGDQSTASGTVQIAADLLHISCFADVGFGIGQIAVGAAIVGRVLLAFSTIQLQVC